MLLARALVSIRSLPLMAAARLLAIETILLIILSELTAVEEDAERGERVGAETILRLSGALARYCLMLARVLEIKTKLLKISKVSVNFAITKATDNLFELFEL